MVFKIRDIFYGAGVLLISWTGLSYFFFNTIEAEVPIDLVSAMVSFPIAAIITVIFLVLIHNYRE